MGRRAAVVGATGCVGRQVCAALAGRGYDVLAVARGYAGHVSEYTFLPLDVTAADPSYLAGTLRSWRAGVVVNAAGRWGPTDEEMVYSHTRLVDRLLESLALLPWRPRLVHLGSIHEYGPVPPGVAVPEEFPPAPAGAYARTKLAATRAVLRATRGGAVDGVVLRAANMYGPYPPPETFLAALVERLRRAAATGFAEGPLDVDVADAHRDYVDVRDVAEAVAAAAGARATGRVVNVGRGAAVGLRELVTLVLAVAGVPPGLVRLRTAEVPSQGGDWTQLDISLARRLLGWSPRIGVIESVRAMWAAAVESTEAGRIP